jgi:hypothetical protein
MTASSNKAQGNGRVGNLRLILQGEDDLTVVPTVIVAVTELVPLGVTEAVDAEQLERGGRLLQLNATALLNPELGVTVTVKLKELPATTVPEEGETEMPKSEPSPPRVTTCGLLGALSLMVSVPVTEPPVTGEKVTLTVHVAPTARVCPQLPLSEKFGEMAILVMFRAAVPEFVRVTLWAALTVPTAWFEKLRLVGDTVRAGAARPVPANVIV